MLGRRWDKIVAVVFALVLVWAAPASAEVETLPDGYGTFLLDGTHGYSILVLALPPLEDRHGEVVLQVHRGKTVAIYRVPAVVTATSIDANLGRVGRISVEFKPRGKRRTARAKCNPRAKLRFQPGAWVGTIEFEGEEGFTRVKTRTARQIVWPWLLIACPFVSEPEEKGPELPGARLEARSGPRSRAVFLRAITNRPGGPLKLTASIGEQRGRLSVFRLSEGFYPGTGFEFDSHLSTATLRPPGPFAGVGTYRRLAEPRARWTGGLSVDLPGRSNLLLTGARFHTSLFHAHFTREVRYDERPIAWPQWGESRWWGAFANQWLTNPPPSISGLPKWLRFSTVSSPLLSSSVSG